MKICYNLLDGQQITDIFAECSIDTESGGRVLWNI